MLKDMFWLISKLILRICHRVKDLGSLSKQLHYAKNYKKTCTIEYKNSLDIYFAKTCMLLKTRFI